MKNNTSKIYETLNDLPEVGVPYELVLVKNIKTIYTYTNEDGWEPVDSNGISFKGLSQYEMNKLLIA